MQEIVTKAIPLKLDISSREAMIVALFGIAALWYLADRAMERGYEIRISDSDGLIIRHVLQDNSSSEVGSRSQLKADTILQELAEQEGTSKDAQELQAV